MASKPPPIAYSVTLVGCLIAISMAAAVCAMHVVQTVEIGGPCDDFGYLFGAREIRQALSHRTLPHFTVDHPQLTVYVHAMRQGGIGTDRFEAVPGPMCLVYQGETDRLALQYPPGASMILALFPEGRAVFSLNAVCLACVLAMAIASLWIARARRSPYTCLALCGLWVGALWLIAWIDIRSYSINAGVIPLLLAVALQFVASRCRANGPAQIVLSLLAGLLAGFGLLLRLLWALALPGLFALQWFLGIAKPHKPLYGWVGGVLAGGVLPLLAYQQFVRGGWLSSGYDTADRQHSLAVITHHLSFYLGRAGDYGENICLLVVLLASVASLSTAPRRWAMGILACAFLTGVLPVLFVLTHKIAIAYYLVPSHFAAMTILAVGALAAPRDASRTAPAWTGLLGVLASAIVVVGATLNAREILVSRQPAPDAMAYRRPLPPQVADSRAWIWSHLTASHIWYYHGKFSFKLRWTDDQTRLASYQLAYDRGEPQFLIHDFPRDQEDPVMKQIIRLGGQLIPQADDVDGCAYSQVIWPERRADNGRSRLQRR